MEFSRNSRIGHLELILDNSKVYYIKVCKLILEQKILING